MKNCMRDLKWQRNLEWLKRNNEMVRHARRMSKKRWVKINASKYILHQVWEVEVDHPWLGTGRWSNT